MMNSKTDETSEWFFKLGCDYYIAARFATFAWLNPVVGNLFHHAIEMYLKGALARKGPLPAFRHDLPALWKVFKQNGALERFDATIKELHRYEDIRYPDSIAAKGMGSTIDIVRSELPAEYKGPPVPEYRICLQDIDQLVEAIFCAASYNPRAFFPNHPLAREFLGKENGASRLLGT
jgi:hypothetical protein